ncbi:MAG: type I polyketide synthase [Propionibacteriales bacterium]|nr:type I polyketide synthase [Propionibacteriales bacterium]
MVQPALFAVMVSLARWWESVGVRPAAVVGHSQGEIAAAVVAGALSVADGARVVARRALALRALAGRGAMAVLRADVDTVERLLQDGRWAGDVEVAAENARDAVVVSGGVDAVAEVVEAAEARGVRATHVAVDYASHSAHVEELRGELLGQLADISPRDARVPLFSTTLRRPVEGTELDAGYWYENLRRRVHLRAAIEALASEGHSAFLEVSPHPVLTAAVDETVSETGADAAVLDTLERDVDEVDRLQRAAGAAYAAGLDVDWRALVRPARVVPLPTYPFEQRRYWLAPRRPEQVRDPIADWFLTETWTSVPPASPRQVPARWWIVVPDHVPAASWAGPVSEALRVAGTTVATVTLADLADEVGPGDGILSLLAVGSGDVSSTLALLARVQDHRGPVWVATTAAVVVADEDAGRVRPDQASVRALGQVAGLERGAAWTGLVDLPADTGPAGPTPQDVEAVVAALLGAEDQVAVRDGQVRARRLVPCEPPPSSQYVPPRGTVVVTGGTSGLGAVTARWLVERGVRSLALLSRRGPDTPGVDDLVAELQHAGAAVTVQACDVTDREGLRRALSAHDEITGVVHAAGLPQHQALADMDTASLRRVLDVKATGAALLDELVPDAELFLLFSSGAAVWGSNGQAAYAAGNAALDALARRRHAAGRAASSVAWGLWETGGMTQDAAAVDYLRDRGVTPMVVELALAALDRVLAAGVPNAVVAQVDWPVFAAAYCAARPRPLLDVVRGPAGPGGAPEEPELAEAAGAEDPPGLSAELAPLPAAERRSRLLRLVRVHAAAVLGHDDPSTIRPRDSFKQLGFDSLAALRLRDSLQKASGLTLSSTLVYDHADATEVAEYLDGCLAVDEQQETAVPQGDGIASLERELIALEDADRAEAVDRLLGLVERLRAAPATARPELAEVDDDLVDADLDELVAALGRELGDEGAT